jgi:hypothetical protein
MFFSPKLLKAYFYVLYLHIDELHVPNNYLPIKYVILRIVSEYVFIASE